MSDAPKPSYDQLAAVNRHYEELIIALTEASNELVSRLIASPTFGEADKAILKQWSLVTNDIHTMSEAHLMTLRSQPAPAAVQ